MTPFFTIITATRNAAPVLPRLLDSLACQTCRDFELLVQDGASTDETLRIAADFQARLPGLSLAGEPDCGIYDAWNRALPRMRGQWALFLGADDRLWEPDTLKRAQSAILDAATDALHFASGGVVIVSDEDIPLRYITPNIADPVASLRDGAMPVPFPGLFVHRSVFTSSTFDPALRIAGDFDFLCAAWTKDSKAARLPFMVARMGHGGLSEQRANAHLVFKEVRDAVHARFGKAWSFGRRRAYLRLCAASLLYALLPRLMPKLHRLALRLAKRPLSAAEALQESGASLTRFSPEGAPVFLLSHNRLAWLKKIVAWLEQGGFSRIIILDGDSSDPALLDYLENCRHRVVRLQKNTGRRALRECGQFTEIVNSEYFAAADSGMTPGARRPDEVMMLAYNYLAAHPDSMEYDAGGFVLHRPGMCSTRFFYELARKIYWKLPVLQRLRHELRHAGRAMADAVFAPAHARAAKALAARRFDPEACASAQAAPAPATWPDVDISVAFHDGSLRIEKFFDSLSAQNYPPASLYLTFVGNAPTDGAADALRRRIAARGAKFAQARLMLQENPGRGGGHDQAIRDGKSRYCLLTNTDVELLPDTLPILMRTALADAAEAAASWEARRLPDEPPKQYDYVTLETADSSLSCLLMRRSAYEKSGGCGPSPRGAAADAAFSSRLRACGHALKYVPRAPLLRRDHEGVAARPLRTDDAHPLVSVITRTCRRRAFLLRQAIRTVCNQTWPNIEMIVSEDGGDSQKNMVESAARGAPSGCALRFIASPAAGRSAAGNAGLAGARGNFLMFLDDDDLLRADHVETLMNSLLHAPGAAAAYAPGDEVRTHMDMLAQSYREAYAATVERLHHEWDYGALCRYNFLVIHGVLFRRELYEQRGGLDERVELMEDWNLWLRYGYGNMFLYVPKTTSLFRTPASARTATERAAAFHGAAMKARELAFSSLRQRGIMA